MENKRFTKTTIAAMKRTAMNAFSLIEKRNKIDNKIAVLLEEKESLQEQIDSIDAYTIMITGGYGSEDIFTKEVITTEKNDKVVAQTVYTLKYPDTIIPVEVPTESTTEPVTELEIIDTEVEESDSILEEEQDSIDDII